MMSKFSAIHVAKSTTPKHNATVIFFHGCGGTGEHMKEWIQILGKNFTFPHIKIIYPTAPLQRYTPIGGLLSNTWFDREAINPYVPEIIESIDSMKEAVLNLIREENDAGIPTNRIVLGGFSMGGAIALHTAYRWERDVAGVFACSSFLNNNSVVYDALKLLPQENLPSMLQVHGNLDELVELTWGRETFKQLKTFGIGGEFHTIDKLSHSLDKEVLDLIENFILKLLPEM